MAKKTFKCPSCRRTFKMAAHLARHRAAAHGVKSKRKVKKAKAGRRKKAVRRRVTRMGRPTAMASRFKLRNLTLEELGEIIVAARAEGRRRVAELRKALA
jgi:uncharacterized C2H2 Zn-finger protein